MYIELEGELGKTKQMKLDNSPDNFTRGKTDTFAVAAADTGRLVRARLVVATKPGESASAAWFLDAVHVVLKSGPRDHVGEAFGSFYHGDWLQAGQVRAVFCQSP